MRPEWEKLYEEYWRTESKKIRDEFGGLLIGGLGICFLSYVFYKWNWDTLGGISIFFGALMLLGCCVVLIVLIAAYLRHAVTRPTELRVKESAYPLTPTTEQFIYFGNKGQPAAIWLYQLNLDNLAKSEVSRHVVPLCSRCGRPLPLGAKKCGPCHGAPAVVVFRPYGATGDIALITVNEGVRNGGWVCTKCETGNLESVPSCEVCGTRRT